MVKLDKKQLIERGVKAAFAVLFVILLFFQVEGRWRELMAAPFLFISHNLPAISLAVMLLILSLLIEAVKWRLILKPEYKISLASALKSTLGGNSLSAFTPNRIGEFAGRILFLPQQHRGRGAVLSLVGSYSQALCTITGGIWAAVFFALYQMEIPFLIGYAAIFIGLSCTLILFITFFNVSLLVPLASRVKFLTKFQQQMAVLSVLPLKTLVKLMSLSILKYLIFNLQFILFLEIGNNYFELRKLIYEVPLIFFVQTAIPSFALAEVGMRGSVAILILGATGAAVAPAIVAAGFLWLLNIILPSALGGLFVLRHKFITK